MLGIEHDEFTLVVGKVIREERKRVGFTQEELGFETDLQRNYISLMELGRHQPTVSTLFKLAKALKTTPNELVLAIEIKLKQGET